MKANLVLTIAVISALTACSSSGPTINHDPSTFERVTQTTDVIAPDWMDRPPKSDSSNLWVTGTANSVDYGSSRQKAMLDAQLHLGQKLNGEISALLQQYNNDVGDTFVQNTTTNVKELVAETDLAGFDVDKITTIHIDGKYQTFVLIRYPLAATNEILKEKLGIKVQLNSEKQMATGQAILDDELDAKRARDASAAE